MNVPPKKAPGAGGQKLTTAETVDLVNHERTIELTQSAFVACGRALEAIRDGRLYRALHRTFEAYCKERWGLDVADRARRTVQRTTAAAQEAEGPIIDLDETGHPIPERAMPYWSRLDEMEELLGLISKARAAIRAEKQEDPIFVEVRLQEIVAILNDAYRQFSLAVPYAVCTACQGEAADTCLLCKGRGVISKFRYDTCVPSELKAIRTHATKK